MNIVILGATKGMGRALARLLAERGHQLFLLGRDTEDLSRSARDLEVRARLNEGAIQHTHCDLAAPDTFAHAVQAAQLRFAHIDAVVITAGVFGTQDALEADLERTQQMLTLNFVNTVLLCEHFKHVLLKQGKGTLCVFSSVAGDRGRKPVVLYGASKAGLSRYLEALDHKHYRDGLCVVDVKPGFVKTSMTAGLKPPPFAGEPEQVARDVLRALERPKAVVYTPFIWRWVMMIIKALPRFVMRKIGF